MSEDQQLLHKSLQHSLGAMDALVGKTLQGGKYTLEQELGQGGFGITFIAWHHYLQRLIVIKTLNAQARKHRDFPQFCSRFQDEARRLARCHHPHIVRVSDFFMEDGLPFMVMDYIPGQTLEAIVLPDHPLSPQLAIHYIRQIADALTVVHGRGLLHRDIKPANIILRESAQDVVLIDFGIAREFTPGMVQTHTSWISEGYAPVEQYLPQDQRTQATDVYGLAATLYTLLTAKVPTASVQRALMANSGTDPLPEPREISPHISPGLNQAVLQGMAIAAEQRPSGVEAWLRLLPEDQWIGENQTPLALALAVPLTQDQSATGDDNPTSIANAPPPGAPARRPQARNYWWLLGLTALSALTGALLTLALYRFGQFSFEEAKPSPNPAPIAQSSPSVQTPASITPTPTPSPSAVATPSPELSPVPTPESSPEPSPSPSVAASIPEPTPSPNNEANAIPGFPVGTSEDTLRSMLGKPTDTRKGYWPNTRAFVYEWQPEQFSLGYAIDRDTERVRQTEVSFAHGVGMPVMLSTLEGMLGKSPSSEIRQGLEQVYQRQSDSYSLAIGGLKGTIERKDGDRIYIGIWEADLH